VSGKTPLKLGIAVSNRSIQRYRGRGPAHPPSQTWRTFLANHRPQLLTAARCTVQTLTFKTLYVLALITHGRRELVPGAVTAHPAAAWIWRQVVEATACHRLPPPGGSGTASCCGTGTPSTVAPSSAGSRRRASSSC
jgi:hypothetical protein